MAATPEISTQLYLESKNAILGYLVQNIDQKLLEKGDEALLRRRVEELVDEKLRAERLPYPRQIRNRLVSDMADEILGYGPIEPLLRDPTVTEVMVNRPDQVYCERFGKIELADIQFRDADHIRHVIDKIVTPLGRRVDESSPMVDARLPDGSRVNAIIPPLSLNGPVLTIRKFSVDPYTVEDLIGFGSLTQAMAAFLAACVKVKLNIIVSGGTGSGKTTLLNVLSSFIPEGDRIVTVEDAAELKLHQQHVVRLESRPPNIEGEGEIKIRDLVRNCLRMRPDRIIVGEVRGGEALDMLQAMNTGHEGSISTVHSNSPRDALSRLETMVMMAGMDLPSRAIREQVAAAVHLIVQIGRMSDGSRKVINVSEVQGMEGNVIVLQDLFAYQQKGVGEGGKVLGSMQATGMVPKFMERFNSAGCHLPAEMFKRTGDLRQGMDTIWIIVIAGAGTVALLIYGLSTMFGRNRAILAERLETYAGIEEEAALATDVEMKQVGGFQRSLNAVLGRSYLQKIEDGLVQADVPMRAVEYVLLRLVLAGLGVILSLFVLPDPNNPTIQLIRAGALGALGYFTPAISVKFHERQRRNKFVSQLADALMLLTNSLRSGYGFLKGLELVAKEMSDPISKELNRMLREINLGATVEQALLNLGRRVNSQDLDIVISAYLIQKDVGGNLTEIMEKVAETIRERIRIHGDIRVLTAQGRLSGLIVGLLPIALFVFFLFNTPDYFAPMFGPPTREVLPHVELPLGVLMLLGAFVWQLIGGYVIYRIIDIKV